MRRGRVLVAGWFLLGGCQMLLGIDDTDPLEPGASGSNPAGSSATSTHGGESTLGGRAGGNSGGKDTAPAGGERSGAVSGSSSISISSGMGGDIARGAGASANLEPLMGGESGAHAGGAPQVDEVGGSRAGGEAKGPSAGGGAGAVPSGGTGGDGGSVNAAGGEAGGSNAPLPPDETLDHIFRVQYPWPWRGTSVCYQIPDRSTLDAAAVVALQAFADHARSLFWSSWQRVAHLSWEGWGECGPDPSSDIRIVLSRTAPSSSELGFPGWYQTRNVVLNTSAKDAEVLYTFGRALGFTHEYGRTRAAGPCVRCTRNSDCVLEELKSCMPSGFCGRTADNDSIMAAPGCGGIESIRPFSPWDVVGAQRAYGTKPSGSIVDANGHCLSLADGDVTPGLSVGVSYCRASENQSFSPTFGPALDSPQSWVANIQGEQRCLGVVDSSSGSSAPRPISAQVCDEAAAGQDLRLEPLRVRGLGDLCLAASGIWSGAEVSAETCSSAEEPRQLWLFRNHQLRLVGTDLCATAEKLELGSRVFLQSCNERPDLQRLFAFSHMLVVGSYCLNISGGLPVPGSPLILWLECDNHTENEVFHFNGQLRTRSSSECLQPLSASLGVAGCSGSQSEFWDYYF